MSQLCDDCLKEMKLISTSMYEGYQHWLSKYFWCSPCVKLKTIRRKVEDVGSP